jgi:glycosyltransferase involved in cell wall biosynthesis
MEKPKIAVIGTKGYPFVYSGFETLVQALLTRLRDRYEFHVYCHRSLFKDRPGQMAGVFLHYVPAIETRHLNHLSHGGLATLHAVGQGVDLCFFVNLCHVPFGFLLKGLGIPCVLNTDGMEWEKPQTGRIGRFLYRHLARWAIHACDELISDSRAIAAWYRRECHSPTTYIPYGAEPNQATKPAGLETWGLSDESYFLVAGRMVPDNDFETVIRGFLASGSARTLVVLGDALFASSFDRRLKRYASERVRFTGFVRDPAIVRSLFAGCRAYFHCHHFGGTNPILLEALASGCCVAAFDCVFNREVLDRDGPGWYFSPDIGSVVTLIERFDRFPGICEEGRKRSRRLLREPYTWDAVAAQYDALFRRNLGFSST